MKKSDETAASYWREQIPWYPSTVFGPYRLRGYSRRYDADGPAAPDAEEEVKEERSE